MVGTNEGTTTTIVDGSSQEKAFIVVVVAVTSFFGYCCLLCFGNMSRVIEKKEHTKARIRSSLITRKEKLK